MTTSLLKLKNIFSVIIRTCHGALRNIISYIFFGFCIVVIIYPIYKITGNSALCKTLQSMTSNSITMILAVATFFFLSTHILLMASDSCPYLVEKTKSIYKKMLTFTSEAAAIMLGTVLASLAFVIVSTPSDDIHNNLPKVIKQLSIIFMMFYLFLWLPLHVSNSTSKISTKLNKKIKDLFNGEKLLTLLTGAVLLFTCILALATLNLSEGINFCT